MATSTTTSAAAAAVIASVAAASIAVHVLRRRRVRAQPNSPTVSSSTEIPHLPHTATAEQVAVAIRTEGVCIIERALDQEALSKLRTRLQDIEPRKLQNRRAHRWEHVHSPEAPPLAELADLEPIRIAVRALLGPKTYLEKAGLVVSHPGAEAQRWHMDTPHLFSVGVHLPPHSLTVFVPMCDIVPSNGPTEFQLGTHVKANLVVAQRHALACCPSGSLVVYDPRIMHRGGPNGGTSERPLIYLTFSRIWYRDTLNP